MRRNRFPRWLISVLLPCFVTVGFAAPAFADQYKQQAAQFEKMLEKQAEADGADAAQKDIERTQKWLDNAKVLLANGDEDGAAKYLRRVRLSLDLVAALVQAGNIQAAADDQEEAYYEAQETQIPELEADIQELEDKRNELQGELSELR